jgi:hypothetical protein
MTGVQVLVKHLSPSGTRRESERSLCLPLTKIKPHLGTAERRSLLASYGVGLSSLRVAIVSRAIGHSCAVVNGFT